MTGSSTVGVRRGRAAACAGLAGLVALALSGCATSIVADDPGASGLRGELTIYAAASLAGAFDEIAAAFAAEHLGVDVRPISYDGSSTLATQLIEGAPADVFASADEANLQKVAEAGRISGVPALFATNTLVIVVPVGNPGDVESLEDFERADLSILLCDAEVPCGRASAELLELAGMTATPVSFEQNVTAVLTKVAAGEADAGLVYATDVVARTDVEAIVPSQADEVINRYPIAAIDETSRSDAAHAFIQYVLGPEAQTVLEQHGFGRP